MTTKKRLEILFRRFFYGIKVSLVLYIFEAECVMLKNKHQKKRPVNPLLETVFIKWYMKT